MKRIPKNQKKSKKFKKKKNTKRPKKNQKNPTKKNPKKSQKKSIKPPQNPKMVKKIQKSGGKNLKTSFIFLNFFSLILGERDLTRTLQSIPFQNTGGVPCA